MWRTDRRFSRITLVRLLSGLGALATAFYVVHATQVLQLPASTIGLFAAAADKTQRIRFGPSLVIEKDIEFAMRRYKYSWGEGESQAWF